MNNMRLLKNHIDRRYPQSIQNYEWKVTFDDNEINMLSRSLKTSNGHSLGLMLCDELIAWCNENIGEQGKAWEFVSRSSSRPAIFLRDEESAVALKLTWTR